MKPVIRKANHCLNYDFTSDDLRRLIERDEKVFLLYCFEAPSPNLKKYIEYGEQIQVHKRYLTRRRKPWYSMEKRGPAPILALVFSRKRMRFVLNSAGVLNLTAFHCIYPKFSDKKKIKALLAYLNSDLCRKIQTIKKREYGGGLYKFEPKDLETLPLLDVTKLKAEQVERLALLFDRLCKAARTDIKMEEQVRNEIEVELHKILEEICNSGKKRFQKTLNYFLSEE